MIDELSIVETDEVIHTVEIDMVKLVVEIKCFGMSFDEFDKETGSSDGLQPKQVDLSCIYTLNESHLHEIHVVLSKHEAVQCGRLSAPERIALSARVVIEKFIIMVNEIPPDHVDDVPVVEPNQHDDVPVVRFRGVQRNDFLEDQASSTESSTQTNFDSRRQIRGYRANWPGTEHQLANNRKRVFGRSTYNRTLDTAVTQKDILEISRERRANLVPAEVLYSNNRSTARHRVYEHYSEQRILCVGENQINLRLCNEESYESLRNSGLQHIHLGIFMIRLHALHRRSAGTNALVVLRDTRWEDSRQIIATMEVDLSAGTQLVYTFPDMILSVNDFHNHVEVAIQTHGYDTWQGGESNLLITMALTGRLSNTSYMGFQYSVENVVDHLTTTGITAIPGERRSIEELEGMSWHLKPPEQTSVRVPSRVAVNERLNRSVSLRFERYRQTPQPPRYSVDQHDREVIGNDNLDEDEEHFIGICLQAPQEEHISYDVCFCESCLNEAMILEEEPLNKVRRSNKPRRSKQRSSEKWSTLGEPSGKWDYYVRYDAPPDITPIEEVAATGWGDEFSDDEVTPGKVTILEERSDWDDDERDWDDDERSGGDILVIQERLAQNQQEFLDEYLPQWDENLAIQKKESESKWENPFAAKSGENHNHTILHLSKEENDDDDLPYPKFRNFKQMAAKIIKKHEEHAFPSSSSQIESTQSYQPPHDAIMGPPVYPPAQQNPPPFYKPDYQFGYPQGKSKIFNGGYGEYHNSQWTLPPAWTNVRVMLEVTQQPRPMLAFVENLLGESEKLMWQQWRTAYPGAYSALEAIADEPQNITSQVELVILLEDPYRGSTDEPDRAYSEFGQNNLRRHKNLGSFLEDFRQMATKSEDYIFPSTTKSFFTSFPPSLSKKNEEYIRPKHPVLLRSAYLQLGVEYKYDRGRVKKCKCFICEKEGHLQKICITAYSEGEGDTHQSISVMVQDTPIEETVFMAIEVDESDDDLEEEDDQFGHHAFMFHPGPPTKIAEMVQSVGSWKPDKELPVKSKECEHEWNENTVTNYTICYFCGILTTDTSRLNCPKCQLTTCALCARNYLGKTVNVKRKQPQKQEEEKDFNSNEVKLLKELLKEKTEQKEEIWQSKESLLVRDLTDALKIIDQLRIEKESLEELRLEKEKLEEQKDEEIRELKAQLQKKKEEEVSSKRVSTTGKHSFEFDIPNCTAFGTTAIIDTGASACCINKRVIPEEALEPLTQTVVFNGLNSSQQATHKIKQGYFLIEESKFKIPLIYAFDMRDSNGIEMLIGANFLRSMKGGIRIEGDEITIYKKVTKIKTSNQTEIAEIAELEVSEEEFLEINESIYFNQEGSRAFQEQFKPVIDRLKQQGYIGEEPLKHWKKNGELCKLDIINPDVTIEDKPLKHVTPAMEDLFRKHVDSLLKIGAIRPSKSRHRTMAMIVNSGTTVDPVTGREVKGKERMVFNYKSLNDNTYKDQYSLPGINTIIKRIGGAKIFSKFDLKSGFHQVAMDEESIPWTAFLVPGGLYEWLVMPFSLKNAPAVFQRKMDKCFKGTESFIAVYIDDILVFSKNEKDHAKHLEKMLKICEDNGLVLSPTKMKIAVSKVDFLGAVIGEGTIKLQPHIIKKIVNFNEEELKTKKGLRSFLGILNYARSHIPKLGILLRPLYEKTNAHGDKRLKPSDYELVRKIKEQVQNLPDLEIPPENAYIILETDGCMEGWGGIVKWKKSKEDPRSSERICAYASGKFSTTQSTIDAEINACINTLEKLKIYYLDKQEVTLRTDCQAIISFYNKTNSNKSSRVRWINLFTGEMKEYSYQHLITQMEEVQQSPYTFSEEYEDHLRRSHEDFQPLPRIFTKTIFTIEEPGALYKYYQLKANQTPIRMDKSDAWRSVAQDIELTAAKEAITTGPIKEKMLEFKIKKPEESSLNWKPWHKDWDAITSNYSEDNVIKDDDNDDDNTINDDDKYRYNRKGFLEDDESSDDSIFIVDPGWDDYSLQAIKSNRPIPLCPEARRARM
ncbi:Orf y [Tanacetum coccineum]